MADTITSTQCAIKILNEDTLLATVNEDATNFQLINYSTKLTSSSITVQSDFPTYRPDYDLNYIRIKFGNDTNLDAANNYDFEYDCGLGGPQYYTKDIPDNWKTVYIEIVVVNSRKPVLIPPVMYSIANPFYKAKIQITCSTPDSKIYYTADGNTPTSNSNLYSTPFAANPGTTIKAIGIKEGMLDSDVATYSL